jgi:tRNA (guanine37-N1)-methyltransferase
MQTIDIITLFPDIFFGPFAESIIARAIKNGLVKINTIDLRDFTDDKRRTVDEKPYGGGPGMLMTPDPLFKAIESLKKNESKVILLSPQGKVFSQSMAMDLSLEKHLILVCGHYEGIDERVRESLIDIEISIGDYILTSGNIPAMAVVDSVVRLIPGVLGSSESSETESFSEGMLEYPQYTRPEEYRGMKVPDVLLSGNHQEIANWRKEEALSRTEKRRPDLLK